MNHAAIIFVGGQSSRMGQNKALLPYRGKLLVDFVMDTVQQAGFKNCYLSGALPGYDGIPDQETLQGPVGGMRSVFAALKKSAYEALLFIPVDMPCLTAELVQKLSAPLGHFEGRCFVHHPLPLYIQTAALQKALELYSTGSVAVKHLLDGLKIEKLMPSIADIQALLNTNTQEEWALQLHATTKKYCKPTATRYN